MKESNTKSIAIIGGGAGGFFAAINLAEKNPEYKIQIFEKSNKVLSKVKISGGGRCNVTHACFDPRELVKFYPRGEKELRGPFNTFMTGDMMEWLERRGVSLKIEADNRVFPASDNSQSIIDCFLRLCDALKIKINLSVGLTDISYTDESVNLSFSNGYQERFSAVVFAAGSNNGIWNLLQEKGHSIVSPLPSLFTFNISDGNISDLAGISVPHVAIKILGTKFKELGPLLITHWGASGPGVLKLSSVAAPYLADKNYRFDIMVDWCPELTETEFRESLEINKLENPKMKIHNYKLNNFPKRLWVRFCEILDINNEMAFHQITKKQINQLTNSMKSMLLKVDGKSTNKAEFVTCGGIDLKEVDFTTFKSKILPNTYIVGEMLNIDALTGGFNFQAAWTGGFIVANSI